METLGQMIRRLRLARGWTQGQLEFHSGVKRSYISLIETGKRKQPSIDYLRAFATVFKIPEDDLFTAAGFNVEKYTKSRPETPEEILERLKVAQPVSVPVYTTFPFHAGGAMEPVEYVYRARPSVSAGKNIEGYVVYGQCMEPIIQNGDIIIVDRDANIEIGDIVAGQAFESLYIGRLEKTNDEFWLVNKDGKLKYDNCQIGAAVIEVIKRLKK